MLLTYRLMENKYQKTSNFNKGGKDVSWLYWINYLVAILKYSITIKPVEDNAEYFEMLHSLWVD